MPKRANSGPILGEACELDDVLKELTGLLRLTTEQKKKAGLTETQFRAMAYIASHGRATAKELRKALGGKNPAHVTRAIKPLYERRDFLTRKRNFCDARRFDLRLTQAGHDLVLDLQREILTRLSEAIRKTKTAAEVKIAIETLTRIKRYLKPEFISPSLF